MNTYSVSADRCRMLGYDIAQVNDILITRETAGNSCWSERHVWVLSRRGARLGRSYASYREAALRANALAREYDCSVWYHESGHPLLLLDPATHTSSSTAL